MRTIITTNRVFKELCLENEKNCSKGVIGFFERYKK